MADYGGRYEDNGEGYNEYGGGGGGGGGASPLPRSSGFDVLGDPRSQVAFARSHVLYFRHRAWFPNIKIVITRDGCSTEFSIGSDFLQWPCLKHMESSLFLSFELEEIKLKF